MIQICVDAKRLNLSAHSWPARSVAGETMAWLQIAESIQKHRSERRSIAVRQSVRPSRAHGI